MEDDLHKVGTDVGDLCEDTACDPEGASAKRLTNGKADETRTDQFFREENEDTDHEKELHAHEEEPNAHAGVQWE